MSRGFRPERGAAMRDRVLAFLFAAKGSSSIGDVCRGVNPTRFAADPDDARIAFGHHLRGLLKEGRVRRRSVAGRDVWEAVRDVVAAEGAVSASPAS